jgi:hypothetical protein
MTTDLRAVHHIPAGAAGPRQARRIISGEVARLVDPSRLEDLKLMITELVGGRIRQRVGRQGASAAPSGRRGNLVLDLQAHDVIRCTVVDSGPAGLPSECSMRILDLLASRWGMVRDRGATRLWFEAELGRLTDARPLRGPGSGRTAGPSAA